VVPCNTFRELVRRAGNPEESEGGVMAIENSIAGSILSNYNLLQQSNLVITGEIYLQIRQHLLANPGVTIADIREVQSHTMALQQCYSFLDNYKWKLVESEDTALSAKHVHQHKSRHIAAIGSQLAASLYDLNMLAKNIQTLENNYTRFLVVQPVSGAPAIPDPDKASVNFHTDHSRGSLARVLGKIADGGVNLSKLQSVPLPGTEFRYSFHADMEFESRDIFDKVINDIRPMTASLKVFGIYKKGVWK
jgi:prephenate dehydratase